MRGSILSNGPDAKSTDLQITTHSSSDPVRPLFVDRLVPSHGRGRGVQAFGLATCVRLAQTRGSVFVSGDQRFSEERGTGGCCWGRFGDMPSVLGLFARKDVVIEGVQARVALFESRRHCPPLWFLVFSTGFFPTWFANYSGSMGSPDVFCPWSASTSGVERSKGQLFGRRKDVMPAV